MLQWGRCLGLFLAAFVFLSLSGPAFSQTGGVSYTYDDQGRLSRVTYTDGSIIQYTYDLAGNRVTRLVDALGDSVPTAVNDSVALYRDSAKTFDPRSNDTDPGGDPLTIVSATQGTNGSVTVASDGSSVTYTPNASFVGSDSFTYTITDGLHTPAPGTVSVSVDDFVTFSIQADVSATEGSGVVFTVTKSALNTTTEDVTIATTTSGTAVSGTDYTAKSQILTFAPAELSKTFSVSTTQDAVYEAGETFTVQLSGYSAGASGGTKTAATGTIDNDDAGPSFTINNVSATEGGNITFTVTKSGLTELSHDVTYATSNGSAAAGSDYTAISATALTFTSAQTSRTVTVTTTGDTVYESDETLNVNLSTATNGAAIADSQGVGTITDNDAVPSFSIANVSGAEGTVLAFTVTKSGSTALSHNVSYATAHNSTEIEDFTAASGTLTFAAADTSKTISITTIQDPDYEWSETFFVDLTNATNSALITDNQAQGTVANDDTPPSFAINDVSANEGVGITFTVTKTGPSDVQHKVSYATANGSASAGSDYTAIALTQLTFNAADTTKTVTVTTLEDTVYEGNETLNVNLSAATSNATISDSQGVGTINEDDPAPSFAINDVSVSEGGNLSFTVTKSGSTALSHNVTYATANGSATAGSDYTAIPATVLTFTSAQTSKTVTVTTTGEAVFENNETVNVNLSGATSGATISDSQGVGTINNDDDPPSFTINDPGNSEGYSMSVVVTKSGLTAFSHNVSYAMTNGTAIADSDYTAQSGTFPFTSSETIKSFSVSTIEDSVYENDETFNVNLSGATNGATIADSQGVGTINNDDPAPSFYVSDVTGTEGGTFIFTISKLDYYTDVSHSVNYATASGSATSGSDFTGKSGSLTFTSSQVEKTVSVTTIDDSTFEGDETFTMNLSGATNGAGISDGVGIGLIHDNDTSNQPPVAVNDSGSMVEFSGKTFYVLTNDSDPDSDPLTITSIQVPSGIAASISCTNTCISVTSFQTGTRNITYTISDGNGGTDSATLTVTVTSSGGGGPPL